MTLYLIETYSKPSITFVNNRAIETGGQDFAIRLSREQVISDIADCQIEHVVKVLEVNEDEKTTFNVTDEIAEDVRDLIDKEGEGVRGDMRDWLDTFCGPGTADEINMAHGFSSEVYVGRSLQAAE